jgi:integrase
VSRRSYGAGGLSRETRAGGREVWVGEVRPATGGRKRRRVLGGVRSKGEADGLTRKQAEEALRTLRVEIDTAPREADRADELTVADLKAIYLRHLELAGRKRGTMQIFEKHWRVWVEPLLGERRLSSLTEKDFDELRLSMRRAGRAPKYIRNVCGNYASVLNLCVRKGYIDRSTADLGLLPQDRRVPELRYLTREEVFVLLRHVPDGGRRETMSALFLTAAMTGMRLGELRALHWEDIDWAGSGIRVHRNVETNYQPDHTPGLTPSVKRRHVATGTPKTFKSNRRIPMADRVSGTLDRLYRQLGEPPPASLVFPGQGGGPISETSVGAQFHGALDAAGLSHHVFHDFRHTFGTAMAAGGVPLGTLQAWMGHEKIDTTMIYAHYAPTAREAAQIGAIFDEAAAPGPAAEELRAPTS